MKIDYFNLAKTITKEFVNLATRFDIKTVDNMTLGELIEKLSNYLGISKDKLLSNVEENFYFMLSERESLYILYDLYTSIRKYCVELEKETGVTVVTNPHLIDKALFKMLVESYKDFRLADLIQC